MYYLSNCLEWYLVEGSSKTPRNLRDLKNIYFSRRLGISLAVLNIGFFKNNGLYDESNSFLFN